MLVRVPLETNAKPQGAVVEKIKKKCPWEIDKGQGLEKLSIQATVGLC